MSFFIIRNTLKSNASTAHIKSTLLKLRNQFADRRGDDYGEKAVILVLVVLAGVAAFSLFGNKVVELINQASSGI